MNTGGHSLLVVDDEPSIRKILERVFGAAGFNVTAVASGEEALARLKTSPPDLVILDLNMPGISGQDVCREIRRTGASQGLPILIITGRTAEGLPASLLDEGADDYVSKPFDMDELLARVRAILRRPRLYLGGKPRLERGQLTVDGASRQVFVSGDPVKLTRKEFDLLSVLVLHSPDALDRSTLMRLVWGAGDELVNDRSLDVHVRRIRQKLGPLGSSLRTVQTIGYQWVDALPVPVSSPS